MFTAITFIMYEVFRKQSLLVKFTKYMIKSNFIKPPYKMNKYYNSLREL